MIPAFGPRAPRHHPTIEAPIGEACSRCGEAIAATDSGLLMPHMDAAGCASARPIHLECHLRTVVGSVGHQRGLCICNGGPGTMDDPPGMTARQAAIAAIEEWTRRGRGRRP